LVRIKYDRRDVWQICSSPRIRQNAALTGQLVKTDAFSGAYFLFTPLTSIAALNGHAMCQHTEFPGPEVSWADPAWPTTLCALNWRRDGSTICLHVCSFRGGWGAARLYRTEGVRGLGICGSRGQVCYVPAAAEEETSARNVLAVFETLSGVFLRIAIFWDVTPYRWVSGSRRFGGTLRHRRQAVEQLCVAGQLIAVDMRQFLRLRCEACNLNVDGQAVDAICVVMVQNGAINIPYIIICSGGSSVPCQYTLGMTWPQ
jgi:hypothetical protein